MKMKPTFPGPSQRVVILSFLNPYITLDVWKQSLEFRVVGDESFESTANHGVLAHQHNGLTSEGGSDFVHLLG